MRVIPIDHTNPLWLAVNQKVVPHVRRLRGFLGDNSFTRYNFRAWEMHDRLRAHQEMGNAFVMVRPARIWFYLAGSDALMDRFRRRTDFPRCVEMTEILSGFGKTHHRDMLGYWSRQPSVTTAAEGLRTLSLHVLSGAGFGNVAPDALAWPPSRWIQEGAKSGEEELVVIERGAFLGWSEGARDCPGKKFSQVEFVATMAAEFRDRCVNPPPATRR
ncbi:hypothetical protein C8A03DRAFT_37146 [Achaetomium macrosporum]|uniref:Cytochrome P450 n=1 Tax=Achaetomium macrosporum TaxID=79813 RepID=A0AAN7C428_9PEZI|nr:hypothetical protein C8A03DRAFT_37146 [Achaetomium macrosporum]